MIKIKTVIMVAAHKKFPMPDKKGYLPILVGAVKNYRTGIEYQRDDGGENISAKNPNYNELTAVYWAWKNLKDVEKLLTKYDVILPKKRNYYIETNYSHYIHAHHKEPLDKTREIIVQYYPNYLSNYDKVMHRTKAHMFNMFIMKREAFDSYCQFVFSVLKRLEDKIDISDYSVQEARVFGYISELLMDVWLETNNFKATEVKWEQLGGKKNFQKAVSLIERKIGIKTKTHF